MVASLQAVWYALMAASMAFFWAVEASPLSVPEKHSAPVAEAPPVEAPAPEPAAAPELLSLPQAERASAPVRARRRPRDAAIEHESHGRAPCLCRVLGEPRQ